MVDADLFEPVCSCFRMATPGCGDAALVVTDGFDSLLQAVPASGAPQGQRLDQRVHGAMDLVQRDLRVFPPAADLLVGPETGGSLE